MRSPTLSELPPPPEAMTIWPWTRGSRHMPETMPDGTPWPLISIVTPSFNQGRFLEQSIRSVLLQGYPRLELIIVDGGSTDGSQATIEQYETWLKYWVSEKDSGPASALNKGFRYASGDILAFLNADDFYLPGCLARVAAECRMHPEADVVSGHGYFAKATGELGVPAFSDRWSLNRFRYGACVLVQPATFFKRSALLQADGFKQNTTTCWDAELWGDMAQAGASFHAVDAFMAAFRLHPDSISGNPSFRELRRRDALMVMQKVGARPESPLGTMLRFLHRAAKFCTHPRRTFRQRLFFYSTLHRWAP